MSGVYHNIVWRGAWARRACAHGVAAPLLRSDAWIGWPRERVSSALQLLPLPLPGREKASFTLHGIYSGFKFNFFKRGSGSWRLMLSIGMYMYTVLYVIIVYRVNVYILCFTRGTRVCHHAIA